MSASVLPKPSEKSVEAIGGADGGPSGVTSISSNR